ncbi:DUF1684 domain-containing protein [Hymenobacter sp. BT730]|uniref:DUF1684 domain-containing protein n=1 Tax=Hymenobacter sp. BT730 TaxID=3063332 RepID=UPI0026E0AA08|nr:DUF1684 domain-containing protein [Hymenobacter sp. BT730]
MRTWFLFLWLLNGLTTWAQTPPPYGSHRPTATEHSKAVTTFQQELNAEYRNPEESPLTPEDRAAFTGLPFFPVNYAVCVEGRFVRDSLSAPFAMQTSTSRRPMYRRYGEVYFTLNGKALKLNVYQNQELMKKPGFEDYLFVPFTDLTNGNASYGGGRYMDVRIGQIQEGRLVLDFNRAYNPFCAYSGRYSCPVPPAENRLPVAIEAGVMSPH